jgi:hypothetical protein
VHAKRVLSLANATLGVMSSASLAVNTIGQGLALARGKRTKHAVKQVDRLLSNQGIDVEELQPLWVCYVVGSRSKIIVAMNWTEFEPDGHATLMLSTHQQSWARYVAALDNSVAQWSLDLSSPQREIPAVGATG